MPFDGLPSAGGNPPKMSISALAEAVHAAMEPPIVKKETSKRDAEVLRHNIEMFVDGVMMEDKYKLADLLNESFTMEMLDLLFKRMTAKLRMILFSRAKTMELISVALDASLPRHTRALATSFIVVGGAANNTMPCSGDDHNCTTFWDAIFGAMQSEAEAAVALAQAQASTSTNALSGAPPLVTSSSPPFSSSISTSTSLAPVSTTTASASSVTNSSTSGVNGDAGCSAEDAAVAELVELIQVEVKDIEHHGAKSLQRSFVEQVKLKAQAENRMGDGSGAENKRGSQDDDDDEEDEDRRSVGATEEATLGEEPRTPTSARTSAVEETDTSSNGSTNDGNKSATLSPSSSAIAPKTASSSSPPPPPLQDNVVGIYSSDTANFSSQILRYFAIRGQKGACILHYLAGHALLVELLLANIGHDDTRTLLLHLIYSDHSDASIAAIFESKMIDLLIQRLLSFGPPRNAFERDRVENTFLLLREIVHAPYLTARGVAISAKTIPLDKVTGQDEYVSICGASREMANSSLRKYTSRKVRHVIHLFMQDNQVRIEQLFAQMICELTFWSFPLGGSRANGSGGANGSGRVPRRNSIANAESLESLSLVGMGHPRPVCTAMLTHLFELTETVDFSEEHTKKAGPNAAAATSVGIDCLNFMCSTHLVRTGTLVVKKKLRNELQPCQLSVNCMMGLRITSIREQDQHPNKTTTVTPTAALDAGFVHSKGNQIHITLDEIESVARSDWHAHGFVVTAKKKTLYQHEMGYMSEQATRSEEYFAAPSSDDQQKWITILQQVIDGDLTALEIFCSDDWRSNVREYRRLRECLITSMELKGHEIMVFLKQVVVLNKRRASGFHLWTVVKFLNAVLSNESKRLDQMFVSAQLLDVLLACYEKYPMMSLLLGEITKMLLFCLGDFKNKRSRRCPIIGKLLQSQAPHAKLLPLLTKVLVGESSPSPFAGTDTLSNMKLLMESIKLCYRDPKSRSQERVQTTLRDDAAWQMLLQAVEHECAQNPSKTITSVPVAAVSTKPHANSSLMLPLAGAGSGSTFPLPSLIQAAPTQPVFQEDIINQITRPCYFSAHGFGSSFLLGDGCAFGYMFKERQGGAKWQKVLLVYEFVSYKLWYFYPSEVDEAHHIQWKWIVPVGVRSRYTHGHDESHSSVGHHGIFVTAYDHHNEGGSIIHHDAPAGTRELHFSVTKLEDRDQWKEVLQNAARTIQQLARDYVAMQPKLKKPDKKRITHCQEASCRQQFKLLRRPHSCKRCGKWFCSKCSSQRLAIPEFGLMHPVRHCRPCFEAAGGLAALKEPTKLFGGETSHNSSYGSLSSLTSGHSFSGHSVDGLSADGASASGHGDSDRVSFSNHELYELAHGKVSPRSMLMMRRRMNRQNSIDSPTSGFKVDEVDGMAEPLSKRRFFGDDGGDAVHFEHDETGDNENDLSPYGSPPLPTFLRQEKEDTRG